MDRRALKILFSTYWSSQGWKTGDERTVSPEDFLYAKQAGVMFDPVHLTHDGAVQRARSAVGRLDPRMVSEAFLASLSTRRLELRSALGSYAVMRHLPAHTHKAPSRCPLCGLHSTPEKAEDLNVLNFERFKWGGVRHDQPEFAGFDLEQFMLADRPHPAPEDLTILTQLLHFVATLPGKTTAAQVQGLTSGFFPSNEQERGVLLQILGYCGILRVPEHPGYFRQFVPDRDRHLPPQRFVDLGYPTAWWRGEFGIDREALTWWFPEVDL